MKLSWMHASALGLMLLSACGDNEVPTLPGAAPTVKSPSKSHGDDAEPQPKTVYKKAYEQARKAVTAKNAATQLDQLDSQIEREKEMMR